MAAISPPLKVGDIDYNVSKILDFAKKAEKEGSALILFPELSITGYTVGDLFHQRILLEKAKEGLEKIRKNSLRLKSVLIIGLPLEYEGKIFNTAAVLGRGKIFGFVPKTYLPNYKEFYEERWFSSSRDLVSKEIVFGNKKIPIGSDLLFRFEKRPAGGEARHWRPEVIFGLEICEDLWTPLPPSSFQALSGATIIFNPSASPELAAKSGYRRGLIIQQSARTISAYIYASSGVHESTTDLVYGGHSIIAENGYILSESKRFVRNGEILISDIDVEHLLHDREKTTSFGKSIHAADTKSFRIIDIAGSLRSDFEYIKGRTLARLERFIDPHPFVPQNPQTLSQRSEEIFSIQVAGLAKRIEQAGIKNLVIGVSGGLDSSLALLVSVKAFSLLGYSKKGIHAYTMPGFGTSKRTKSNTYKLCEALDVGIEEISIAKTVLEHFKDIKHDEKKQDTTYENAQARYRTMILMDKANQIRGLVVGTGDLSELALGWNTFSGDHISHYDVNAGVPKTLVRYLVDWVAVNEADIKARKVLQDILATPISPELIKTRPSHGRLGLAGMQKTEEIIGPYELHDFFLYHFLRWGSSPSKILFLATQAFGKQTVRGLSLRGVPSLSRDDEAISKISKREIASLLAVARNDENRFFGGHESKYSESEIKKWLRVFLQRFFGNQWKRSVMPDGPKVGSVSLSPRGDWRMPSDAEVKLWLDDLK